MINVWNKSRAPKQTFTYMKKLHINTQVYGAPGKKKKSNFTSCKSHELTGHYT